MHDLPVPVPNADTATFWDGCRAKELRYQRCTSCGAVQIYPRTLCRHCHEPDLSWHVSAGTGTLLSWTEVARAPTPAFRQIAPYILAIVDIDEGFRLMTNLAAAPGEMHIGMRIEISFVPRGPDGAKVPEARPLRSRC